jgi:hypothetical protein
LPEFVTEYRLHTFYIRLGATLPLTTEKKRVAMTGIMRKLTWLILFATVACSSPMASSDQVRVVGTIAGFNLNGPRIDVPDTVAAGQTFTVEVTTYGNGCTSEGDTEVRLQPQRAVVTPYDVQRRAEGVVCPDILNVFRHRATLRFEQPGVARVTIQGIQEPSGEVITVERTVLVR